MKNLITIGLPSKGRLREGAIHFFKKNNCKVFFSADGCDELFGGQQIYYNIFKKSYNYKLNKSPYSSLLGLNNISQQKKLNYYKNYLNKSNLS